MRNTEVAAILLGGSFLFGIFAIEKEMELNSLARKKGGAAALTPMKICYGPAPDKENQCPVGWKGDGVINGERGKAGDFALGTKAWECEKNLLAKPEQETDKSINGFSKKGEIKKLNCNAPSRISVVGREGKEHVWMRSTTPPSVPFPCGRYPKWKPPGKDSGAIPCTTEEQPKPPVE